MIVSGFLSRSSLPFPPRTIRWFVEGLALLSYPPVICIFTMKRFFKFTGAPSPAPASTNLEPAMAPVHPGPLPNKTALHPQYTVPPFPHPIPYQHLGILVTSKGLLLRPHIPGSSHTESYVRMSWGLAANVELVEDTASKDLELDWSKAAVVYGVLGSLDLFTGM